MANSGARLVLALVVVACGPAPQPRAPGAGSVVLSEDAPPAGYVELQSLSAQSGKGCGLTGESGSRDDAEAKLRNEAAGIGATYVQLTDVQQPRPNHQCLEHEYKLSGVAYRKDAPAPKAPVAAAVVSAAAPTTPPVTRVCIPGATQACLGPAACQGAQACRDDASGFLPCDCGPAPKTDLPAAPATN